MLLFGPLSAKLAAQIEERKTVALAYPVTRGVSRALHDHVAQDDGVEIMFLARPRGMPGVIIQDCRPRSAFCTATSVGMATIVARVGTPPIAFASTPSAE